MKLFFVVNPREKILKLFSQDANILISYMYSKNVYSLPFKTVMVDSGAYTLQKGISLAKLEDFARKYRAYIEKFNGNLFVELDLYNLFEISVIEDIRSYLEKTGKYIMPVWHKNLGIEYFRRLCKKYPYIGIGRIRYLTIDTLKYLTWYAYKNGVKTHCFGKFGRLLFQCPFYSADALSWLAPCLYCYRPIIKMGTIKSRKFLINNKNLNEKIKEAIEVYLKYQEILTEYWRKRGVVYED